MYIPKDAVVAGRLGLAKVSSGMPITNTSTSALSDSINITDSVIVPEVINSTEPAIVPEIVNSTDSVVVPEIINGTDTAIVPEIINGTDTASANITDGFLWLTKPPKRARLLAKRDLPPRDRTLADHMENYGENLPECYKKCMRSEDGKSSIHMGKDTLGQICGVKWPLFAWWSEHHIYWCVNGKHGCQDKQEHRKAYSWLKSTCGDKPS